MIYDWLVTWRHASGSIKEPDDVVCTQCGIRGMRWFNFVVKTEDVMDALFKRTKSENIQRVPAKCAGGGNAG